MMHLHLFQDYSYSRYTSYSVWEEAIASTTKVNNALYNNTMCKKQGKSEGFDSCDRPSNLTQFEFKSSIFRRVWPSHLMDDLAKH